MKMDFYVYVIFRMDGSPCYVGKGRGKRCQQHGVKSHNRRLASLYKKASSDLPVVMVRIGLTESSAFEIERAFIAAIGRGRNGPLVNMTDGGEGTSGYSQPDHVRKLHSDAITGIVRSEETRTRIRLSKIGKPLSPEALEKRRAKILNSDAWRLGCLKMAESKRGSHLSDEHRAAIKKSLSSGFNHTPEAKAKISAARRLAEQLKRAA